MENGFPMVKKRKKFLANRGGVSQTPVRVLITCALLCLKIVETKATICCRTNATNATLLPIINTLYFNHVL